ncbi:hypothetical protein GALMADRAFT_68813 [Galerina marginata CBS 339.88]|uniref:Uncharacterized protein n=1 Tax=Galerina marginata (strain CBS 339.88) TaxID=685588 RepID=A0A067SX97_GALM3|nr:hypothetical protein GALMADRAFT_68813 [Galerina marginata CBS 339.88]
MTSTLPPLVQAFSGAVGSASANALIYPLDLITTRLQLDPPKRSKALGLGGLHGAVLIFRHILRKYGWRAFYDGLWADTCATLLSNFFYFYCYAFLRSLSTRRLLSLRTRSSTKPQISGSHKPTMIEELILGFIAGVASRAISTPLNIVTLRLQTEREVSEVDTENKINKPMGMIDVVKAIYQEAGLSGFWRGFKISAVLSLNPSITLACFQMYRRILAVAKSSRLGLVQIASLSLKSAPANANLHPQEAFFGAAVSNSIAVSILYPLILAKKRLQSSSATMQEIMIDGYQGKVTSPRNNSFLSKDTLQPPEHRASGIEGLYQGYQMKIITGFLSEGVTFLVKGRHAYTLLNPWIFC